MPRDSSGNYTLPEAAFVAGTTIVAADVNSDMSDLGSEIQDSLSRSGKGGMTAPLRCANGSAVAPSFSFTNDTGVGFYRKSSGVAGLAAGGNDVGSWTSTGMFAGSASTAPIASSVFLAANQSTTSSTMGDLTGLSFSVTASGVYVFEAVLAVTRAGTATNWQLDVNGPAAPTSIIYNALTINAGTVGYGNSSAFATALGLLQGVTYTSSSFHVTGVLTNGANAGTVQLRFSSSDNTTSISCLKGSILRWQKVA